MKLLHLSKSITWNQGTENMSMYSDQDMQNMAQLLHDVSWECLTSPSVAILFVA